MAYQAILGDPISGMDVTAYLEWDTWNIDATYGQRGRTAKFFLSEDVAAGSGWNILVLPESRFTLKDTTLGVTLFSGVVTTPNLKKEGPTINRWELNCKDGTIYADNRIVKGDYTNKTMDFIIKDLTAQANCGITTNNVPPGPQIARVVINYFPLTDALNRVCQYASQGALWGWFVDDSLDLHTIDGLRQVARTNPIFTDVLGTIDNATYFAYVWDGFYYEWAGDSVRNRIKVRGGSYTGPATDSFTGNGGQWVWPLTFPINTGNPQLSVTVGGSGVSASIDSGASASTPVPAGTCLFTQTPSGQWFIRFGTVPSNGQAIVANYQFQMPVLSQVDSLTSQIAYSLQPNSLKDPSFELSGVGVISLPPGSGGWGSCSIGTGTATVETANPNSGTHDVALTNPSSGNYGGMFQKQGIPIVAGQKITISAYIKASAAGNTWNSFRATYANPGANINAQGVASGQPSAQAGTVINDFKPNITTSYTQYSTTLTIPAGYSWLFIEFYNNNNGSFGTVYVDDVAVQVASPNGGIFEMYLSDPTINDVLTAKARGQREISEYGFAEERLYFVTRESNGFHVNVGDVVQWSSSMVPDYSQKLNPIGVNGKYLISQLHIEGRKGPYRVYGITAVRVG